MSRFLSLKLFAIDGSKSRAVTRIRAAAATGSGSNLVRHFSLGQALGLPLVHPNFYRYYPKPIYRRNNPWATRSIAVVLTGCGYKDGTDVQEAIYTIMHISRHNIRPTCFAPEGFQRYVVDHLTDQPDLSPNAAREILLESARMMWTPVGVLRNLNVENHQGLIIPGGKGIGYNLTDYFTRADTPHNAHAFRIDEALVRKLRDFHRLRKPMGFLGVASILAARLFPGVHVTYGDTRILRRLGADYLPVHARRLNAVHEDRPPNMVFHDPNHNIFSAPGALAEHSQYHLLSNDIGVLVDGVVNHRWVDHRFRRY